MRSLLICSIVGMGLAPSLTRAESSTSERIAQSIEKLSSKRPVAREQAMKVLEFAGEPALEALRKAAQSDDIDVSKRALAILSRIEREVENRKNLDVPRFTLKFDDATLRGVVAELNRKLKTQLFLDEKLVANKNRTVSFEVKEATAFDVIAKFMEVANLKENDNPVLTPNPNEGRRILRGGGMIIDGRYGNQQPPDYNRFVLMDGKSDQPSVNAGPLRIRVVPNGKESVGKTSNNHETGIKLDVFSIQPQNWRGLLGVDIHKAVDEHGQNLTQSYLRDNPNFNPYLNDEVFFQGGIQIFQQAMAIDLDGAIPGNGMNPRHLPITFLTGKKPSRTLKELQGVIHGRLLTPESILLTIDDVAKVTAKDTFKAANFSIQILEVQLQPKKGQQAFIRYRMTTTLNPFQMEFGGGAGNFGFFADELGIPGGNQPKVVLRDPSDTVVRTTPQMLTPPIPTDGLTIVTEMQLNLSPINAGKAPFKLVVSGQREVEIAVPFSLKNVQLP